MKLDNIRLGLTYDDILLIPEKSEVVPSEVNMPADGGTKEVQIQTKGSWTIS